MSAAGAGLGAPEPRLPFLRRPTWLPRAARLRAAEHDSPVLRVAAFAALGAFAAAHWGRLVAGAPAGRLALALLISVALAGGLTALRGVALRRTAVHATAAALTVVAGATALAVTGLEVRLLLPGGWSELAGGLDGGLSGIRTVTWPYAGEESWVRLAILLGAPLMLTLSAALAFWPARRGGGALRACGLLALLALYGTAATENDPGSPLARGLLLFLLVAAWLWLPRLSSRVAGPAVAVAVLAGVLALPAAARLDSDAALIDYQALDWFGGEDVTFNWDHSYGPLDWPREGTTLLNIKSSRPLYWKAETLDSFDGLRWRRSDFAGRTRVGAELPPTPQRRWVRSFRVTVRSLRTDFVIGAGTPFAIQGIGQGVNGSADGTVRRVGDPLERGDSYTVRAYVPTPGRREMRAAPADYGRALREYTTIDLPAPGRSARRETEPPTFSAGDAGRRVEVEPSRGGFGATAAGAVLSRSAYSGTYALARRLTAGAPTVYDAVRRVEDHLQRGYTYSERPPTRDHPLEAFLLEDKIGYCQQFSGAMALMLRMAGIPARVVSGFSPGSLNRDSGEFRVRDLDAHSWVEVYFAGIGWATFDPTPSGAPADRAGQSPSSSLIDRPQEGNASSGSDVGARPDAGAGRAESAEEGGQGRSPVWLVLLGAALALVAVAIWLRRRARAAEGPEGRLHELERALELLGRPVAPGTTLLDLEAALRETAGPGAAAYVARLRQVRFSPRGARPPGRAARRALRRELTRSRGPLVRLRGYVALPPGGSSA
jgi:protein-glutamine gamma-glutamyltransferase